MKHPRIQAEIDAMVADYTAGATVKMITLRYRINPQIVRQYLRQHDVYDPARDQYRCKARTDASKLTTRRRDILRLIAEGNTNKSIGHILHISENTVKVHVKLIISILGARDRANAVHIAHQRGILRLP